MFPSSKAPPINGSPSGPGSRSPFDAIFEHVLKGARDDARENSGPATYLVIAGPSDGKSCSHQYLRCDSAREAIAIARKSLPDNARDDDDRWAIQAVRLPVDQYELA